ncbi:hypothetical protein DUNSADRAFT_5569 [Dunaliella salina]|uniref:Encoded protein n=1 Tax=Dunaliella salina TaxID=3046 RepID=A0ABQ7GQ13_DUNSA|nr:hypothetical protein DUNSADRAFT_5569 [Dunaliella salina]|eukprot:KAF5836694.1 hypothetical protein DUNSADRAFT_5569 [Dunaliella salina]
MRLGCCKRLPTTVLSVMMGLRFCAWRNIILLVLRFNRPEVCLKCALPKYKFNTYVLKVYLYRSTSSVPKHLKCALTKYKFVLLMLACFQLLKYALQNDLCGLGKVQLCLSTGAAEAESLRMAASW